MMLGREREGRTNLHGGNIGRGEEGKKYICWLKKFCRKDRKTERESLGKVPH